VNLAAFLSDVRVLPVLTISTPAIGVAVVNALVGGGARAVEITLRTDAAPAVIEAVRAAHPSLPVGVGTVRTPTDLDVAVRLGAAFAVAPGLTDRLIDAAREREMALLPGVATAAEAMRGRELGLDCFKLFPADAVNGLALLRAFAQPLSDICFCPTGGVGETNFLDYLALPNVVCVGGSWLAPPELVAAAAWDTISANVARVLREASRSQQ
jgi:2-dehydro-3-deoxyphosphogluconate aldolase / (4S)-4-hydroxy-2-oxoglutarate aldolase